MIGLEYRDKENKIIPLDKAEWKLENTKDFKDGLVKTLAEWENKHKVS